MIDEIRRLAEEAGREILKIYTSGDWTVTDKVDKSPITQADLAAHAIIFPRIGKLSADPIVSEEGNPELFHSHIPQGRFWLVDPLDGTRDFVARRDTFVVCIALIENGYPILGVIHAPVSGETYWAEKGHGAHMTSDPENSAQKIFHSENRTNLIAAGSRSMPSEKMQLFYDHFSVKEVRRFGSALKFCRLAEGEVDLYPRFGPTSEWDTAAGQIIAEESGCKVIDIATGERLRYGKPAFLNSGGFVASRADLDIVGRLKNIKR